MNRHLIIRLVRENINSILRNFLYKRNLSSDKKLEDGEFKELVEAYVPFFEICSLCKWDNKCGIQNEMRETNEKLYAQLTQKYRTEIGLTYTICKCGYFENVQTIN